MIITQEKNKQVVQSHDFDEVNCTIDAEDMRYVASLLRNNYSNPALAVVREISANAIDANLEAGSTRPIEIKLPTKMNSTFLVRDFGGGLSQEEIFGLYSKYGKSTKRKSNNYIGAFGIGKFAPLSYGDSFTCVSYHGGEKASYNVFVNEDDDTKIVQLHKEPSDEPSGLCIEVAISDGDDESFKEIVKDFFKFFPEEDMPKFLGVEDGFIQAPKKSLESPNGSWFFLDSQKDYYYNNYNAKVIMGRVSYPLNHASINLDNYIENQSKRDIAETLLRTENFCLRFPLGSLKLHHSREALEYNKPTQKVIAKKLLQVIEEIQVIAKQKLADSNDLWDAKRNYAKIVNAMPHNMRNVFSNAFEWNGIKITSPDFNRDYQLQDDLIVTQSWREKDSDSRNGFKIRSQKMNRAICQDNYLFLIQDLESSHGNNLRVRTLMNEDETLDGVYIIHPKNEVAEDCVWNTWEFGKIDKKHIKYTSSVDKEKPNRSGVRKANGSRANIPLFKMTREKYARKNSDFWANASEDIDSVEEDVSEVDGSWEGKLIFVPIKNFKIDLEDHSWDLNSMKSRMEKIRVNAELVSNSFDVKELELFGIRVGDVKKLDKSVWVSFVDFYKEYSKAIVLDNLEECENVFTSIKLQKDENYNELSEFRCGLGTFFEQKGLLPIADSHPLISAKKLWNEVMDSSSHYRANVYYLLEHDEAWSADNLNEKVNAKEFVDQLKSLEGKYGLLCHFFQHFSNWRSLDDFDGLSKEINRYVSLCDNEGDGA